MSSFSICGAWPRLFGRHSGAGRENNVRAVKVWEKDADELGTGAEGENEDLGDV